MYSSVSLREACHLQSLLSANGLSGACVSAGRLAVLEVNVPPHSPIECLSGIVETESGEIQNFDWSSLLSCVRRYPDGSLKIDFQFGSRDEASAFVAFARQTSSTPA